MILLNVIVFISDDMPLKQIGEIVPLQRSKFDAAIT